MYYRLASECQTAPWTGTKRTTWSARKTNPVIYPQILMILTVKLSLSNCIISVLSLYDSSLNVSSSAIASSKA